MQNYIHLTLLPHNLKAIHKQLCPSKLTHIQALGGKGRGEVCSLSAGQRLKIDLVRLKGHCRQVYYRSPAALHIVSLLWTEAWRVWNERELGSGLDRPLHQGLGHSVWHCGRKVRKTNEVDMYY